LANTAQARKRARQAQKHRLHNASRRSLLRTRIKQVLKAIESGDQTSARAAFAQAVPIIDKMVKTDMIHRNKADRHKSRLNARIKSMA
jgi:small subunit ribosomal protein S20